MGFAGENDALNELERVFLSVLKNVKENCVNDLSLLSVELSVPEKLERFTYDEVLDALASHDVKLNWGDDFPKEVEHKLPEVMKSEAFLVTRWPTMARAFYSQPCEEDEEKCLAYDLVYKGMEIASGAQRIHDPSVLITALKKRGLKPESFESYIDAFKYGPIPHAGWSIGAERITMALTNQKNIRECSLFPRDRTRISP